MPVFSGSTLEGWEEQGSTGLESELERWRQGGSTGPTGDMQGSACPSKREFIARAVDHQEPASRQGGL